MSKIIITSSANNFNIAFGEYTASSPELNATSEACFPTSYCSIKIKPSQGIIKMNVEKEGVLILSHEEKDDAMIVESVNGDTPSDLQNLYDLLKTAKG